MVLRTAISIAHEDYEQLIIKKITNYEEVFNHIPATVCVKFCKSFVDVNLLVEVTTNFDEGLW